MPEVVFVILILGAVIFFGALLSIGNERQRKAIDGIREQAAYWAEQDLFLKRARAAREVHVDDPLAWLAGVVSRAMGESPTLTSIYPWKNDEARAIVAVCADGQRLVVTPLVPRRFLKAIRPKSRSRLRQAEVGLLGDHPKRVPVHELSVITAGAFFDLEAAQAWQQVTGALLGAQRMYLFEVPAARSH